MVVLRRTGRLRAMLPESATELDRSDTALGDWYVNRVVVDRRPLLLMVSAESLLPIVVPAKNVKGLPARLPQIVRERLDRLGVADRLIDAEVNAMSPVNVAKTADRAVLGILVEFSTALRYYFESSVAATGTPRELEEWLQETPCFVTAPRETIHPPSMTAKRLHQRWDVRLTLG
jgi:hypothetical protein